MSLIRSLSGRLLILTILFVMLAEVLIFVPSLARFREDYLRERLSAANIVAIAMEGRKNDLTTDSDIDYFAVPEDDNLLEARLLASAEVRSIALRQGERRMPILRGDWRDPVNETYLLDEDMFFDKIVDAGRVFFANDRDRVIRVIGMPDPGEAPTDDLVEVTLREGQLADAMIDFGLRVLNLSLIISMLTAALVFLSLNRWLVRPVRRLIEAMTDFRASPEAARIVSPGAGRTELDEAERELSLMQTDVRAALAQKTRLAALGEAVAKINHDLRNMLATAQIVADRLEQSDDPKVKSTVPKLLRSLDRATDLCTRTLTFGKVEEPAPVRRRVPVARMAEEVAEALGSEAVSVTADIPPDLYAEADADQLFRILQNLTRNAEQAMTGTGTGDRIALSARRDDGVVTIDVTDNGPGMPKVARENLFKAFMGSARKGGTGLGLNIARELARGHGGDVDLIDSTTEGTTFRVTIPDSA